MLNKYGNISLQDTDLWADPERDGRRTLEGWTGSFFPIPWSEEEEEDTYNYQQYLIISQSI